MALAAALRQGFTLCSSAVARQQRLECRLLTILSVCALAGVWATQPHNEPVLGDAFAAADRVLLIFSVNGSGHFQGYARMAGPPSKEQVRLPGGGRWG